MTDTRKMQQPLIHPPPSWRPQLLTMATKRVSSFKVCSWKVSSFQVATPEIMKTCRKKQMNHMNPSKQCEMQKSLAYLGCDRSATVSQKQTDRIYAAPLIHLNIYQHITYANAVCKWNIVESYILLSDNGSWLNQAPWAIFRMHLLRHHKGQSQKLRWTVKSLMLVDLHNKNPSKTRKSGNPQWERSRSHLSYFFGLAFS